MKVYLGAISGHVPGDMLRALAAFLDFCCLVRRNAITSGTLVLMRQKLADFHQYRRVFIAAGVRTDISLPRQHALSHYPRGVELFGSLNGLCSSITESKHIKAVKEPWRRSNRHEPLLQMLQTICRIDKMAALRSILFKARMLVGTTLSYTLAVRGIGPRLLDEEEERKQDEDDDLGPIDGPKTLSSIELARTVGMFYHPTAMRTGCQLTGSF